MDNTCSERRRRASGRAGLVRPLGFGLLLLGVLFWPSLSGCAKNPVTGDTQLVLISEQQEIAYGREAHPEVLSQFGRLENESLQRYLDRIGQRLAALSHRPDLPWHFTVVDVPVVNAFALPGGFIYFTREILAYMNNEAELAGVLGHEIGHVTARHSVTQISRAQLASLGLGLGSIFSPTFRQLSEFAELGVGLLFLKYGRDAERQSDELGVGYMSQAGYDPLQLSRFFEVFQRLQENRGQSLPDWLSTHPAPPDRIQATRQLAQEVKTQSGSREWRVEREAFLQQIDGLVFGENPREGFMQDGLFLHPDLKFQLQPPAGWSVQNSKRAVAFTQPSGQAQIQLTLAPPEAGTSPEGRAQEMARSRNVQLVAGERRQIHANPAFLAHYRMATPAGEVLEALAAFIRHGGHLYQIVGMTPSPLFRRYAGVLETSLTSFAELRDRRALALQPDRLQLHRARAGETLRRIAQGLNHPRVSLDDLSLLNRIEPDEPLEAGTWVKLVVAGRR